MGATERIGHCSAAAHHREHHDVIVIGGGQAGLTVGYYLAKRGLSFVILDAERRVGDAWRKRWDSLRLFSPARFDALVGMPFPAPPDSFPSRDEMADYLEAYAQRFALPIRSGARVTWLGRRDGRFIARAADAELEAHQVVVAMSDYQVPRLPRVSDALATRIVQLHSSHYKSAAQLKPGPVLVVGAGNSGAEIAVELAALGRDVWLAGRDVPSTCGETPIRAPPVGPRVATAPR